MGTDEMRIVVRTPCCSREVSLWVAQGSLRQPRRLTCRPCARAWRLDFLADAEVGWTAAWTLVWAEPALRPRWWWRR